jgi:hypothetical protein
MACRLPLLLTRCNELLFVAVVHVSLSASLRSACEEAFCAWHHHVKRSSVASASTKSFCTFLRLHMPRKQPALRQHRMQRTAGAAGAHETAHR